MDIARQLGFDGHWLQVFPGTEADVEDLWRSSEAKVPGVVVRQVRGQKAKTEAQLFNEFAAAWQFPSYFGENWDALDECLADLSWVRADVHVIGIRQCLQVLESQPDKQKVLWAILGRQAQARLNSNGPGTHKKGKALLVAVQCLPNEEPQLRHLLGGLKIFTKN